MSLDPRNRRILVIDDDEEVAWLYKQFLCTNKNTIVDTASTAGEGKGLAEARLYDIVICDAKMAYRGSVLGGIVLAEELSKRFGTDSVLLVSQVIDETQVKNAESRIPFLLKPRNISVKDWFNRNLLGKIEEMMARQFGFIAMPFGHPELDTLYNRYIEPTARSLGFRVCRVDEDSFTRDIMNRIYQMIRQAHFVVFMASGNNPNVFYEAGFAHGLGKEVIMCAQRISDLPFDVRQQKCLAFGGRKRVFAAEFKDLLSGLRGQVSDRKETE